MRASAVDIPHFTLPFQLAAGGRSVSVEEQDTSREIGGCVELVLRYPRGYRPELPEFGIPALTFRQVDADGLPLGDVEAAVETWEPRVDVLLADTPDALDQAVRNVAVRMRGTS